MCRAHSSWGSRPRVKACTFAHYMAPADNLHWLIKAQLAKRGGHRPHTRITPAAAPGYIAALRETNGGGAGSTPQPKWRPKANTGDVPQEGYNDLPVSVLNQAVRITPGDFVEIGFPPLERRLDKFVNGNDGWTEPTDADNATPWNDRSLLTDRQIALESGWDQHRPQSHIDMEPCVGNVFYGPAGQTFLLESAA